MIDSFQEKELNLFCTFLNRDVAYPLKRRFGLCLEPENSCQELFGMKGKTVSSILAFGLFWCLPWAAVTTDEMPTKTFEDSVVVTATAREESADDLPHRAVSFDREDLEERQVRTVPESLGEVPGILVQKTSHGQGSPYLRGFTGFRTLFLIDGVRLNSSVLRDGPNQYWNTVDVTSADRLEVVSGPASSLYGSDSIGGTVQLLTAPPPGSTGEAGGRLDLRLSSAESSSMLRLGHGGRLGSSWGYRLGASFKNFGDLEAGGEVGVQEKTGYEEADQDFKLAWSGRPGEAFSVAWQRVDLDDAWRSHKTIFARPFRGTTVGSDLRRVLDQDRQLAYANYRRDTGMDLADSISARLSWQRQEEGRERVRKDGRLDLQGFEVETLGLSMEGHRDLRQSQWTWGLETYDDQVGSFRRDFDAAGQLTRVSLQGPVADGAEYRLSGAFVQSQWEVGERLRLFLGGRFSHAQVKALQVVDPQGGEPFALEESWQRFTGSARFLLPLGERGEWRLFGGVSQAFRAPNLSDLTRFDSARSQEIETPSPDLDPEDFVAWELGLRWRSPSWSMELTAHHTDLQGLVVRVPTGRIVDGDFEVTKRNAGDGFSQGAEFTFEGRLTSRLSVAGSYAWLDGEVDTFADSTSPARREPLDRLMPARGRLAFRWQVGPRDLWVEASTVFAERADRLSSRDLADTQRIPPGGTPSYQVFHLRAGWQWTRRIAGQVAVENLTDEAFRIHGSGLNEPGRNFVVSAHVRF